MFPPSTSDLSSPPDSATGLSAGPDTKARATEAEVDSADLMGAATTLVIRHGDDRYLLRRTRQGKLILTK